MMELESIMTQTIIFENCDGINKRTYATISVKLNCETLRRRWRLTDEIGQNEEKEGGGGKTRSLHGVTISAGQDEKAKAYLCS